MKESKADLLLHPVRMRIVQSLINGTGLTVQQMQQRLPDIPQASFYRHLKKLVEGNIIHVLEEHQVRGTVEKVYGIHNEAIHVGPKDMKHVSKEEHMAMFMKYMVTVLTDFERYMNQVDADLVKDMAGYRQASFYATDDEYVSFLQTMGAALRTLIDNNPGEGRKKRTLSTIVTTDHSS
ncbi:helix-turn-helix domain-containing protein [Radiobacillus deserti]|uniref:Helix-turn-helix domain-containing protein n=1 Tax=Radiobacillus deserti TaxID=2594883 RepID=A0A516KG16_9BACI|nr:helix-turn-helix domain-containing protein [Radiobacillus deserti]QDP40345.1 helix-turn-helix domain-containing protein [Radiobacillus deserti]